MINIICIIIVCFTQGISVFITLFALFRSQSEKKNYFILMQVMVVLYLFGHLLELTSANADEAFTAIKVLYMGGCFVTVFAFFFVCDYCNIKVHPVFIRTPMLLLSLAEALAIWTNRFHGLVYRDYSYNSEYVHILSFTPGPLYFYIHIFPIVCLVLSLGVLLNQITKWKNKYQKQLIIVFICVAIPLVTELAYYLVTLAGLNKYNVYLTPHSLALMSVFLYMGVMRFNMFEIISIATVTAMEHVKEGFVLVDDSENYLSSNPAAEKILPGLADLIKGESIYSVRGWPEKLKQLENDAVEFSVSSEGIRKYYRTSVSPVFNKKHVPVAKIILFREVTDSVKLMKELESAAYIDALTGQYNRKHFAELAEKDIKRALRLNRSIYTAMLDLDFFKKVNDTYGHAAGDLVLKTVAGVIRQTIRSYDLLGRYGGEEFVLLITDLDISTARNLVERIRKNIENLTINFEGTEILITCSIGLASFYEDDTLEASIKKADAALYRAKNAGRNQVKVYGY